MFILSYGSYQELLTSLIVAGADYSNPFGCLCCPPTSRTWLAGAKNLSNQPIYQWAIYMVYITTQFISQECLVWVKYNPILRLSSIHSMVCYRDSESLSVESFSFPMFLFVIDSSIFFLHTASTFSIVLNDRPILGWMSFRVHP